MLQGMFTSDLPAKSPTSQELAPARAEQPVYVIAAHPEWRISRVTARLMAAARTLPDVAVNDLYSSYPDYAIDVHAEQRRLQAAQLVVMLFPLRWYAMPALLKLWVDDVLSYGWAYGPTRAALVGKRLWLVASAGGPDASYQPDGYNGHSMDEFLLPWQQMARLCGMRYLPPLVLYGANRVSDAELEAHTKQLTQALLSWHQWASGADSNPNDSTEVPTSDRPLSAV